MMHDVLTCFMFRGNVIMVLTSGEMYVVENDGNEFVISKITSLEAI